MAAKKPTKPKKFKQARTAAKADAKRVFKGKPQARLKDPTVKLSADDAKTLREVSTEAKGNYITDAQGNKVNVKPTETAKERFKREGADMRNKFREQMRSEGLYEEGKTKTTAKKAAAPAKKAEVKKPTVKSESKTMTRAEKSAANKAKWAKMSPTERKNWKASGKPVPTEAATKAPKRPTLSSLKKNEAAYLDKTRARLAAAGKSVPASKTKELAIRQTTAVAKRAGGTVAQAVTARPVPGSGGVVKKGSKLKKGVKATAALALGAEVVSLAKGSTAKDAKEIVRLKEKLARLQGKPGTTYASRYKEGVGSQASQLLNLTTFGLAGQTRRGRMDELNTKIASQEKKNAAATAKTNKGLRYGPRGESLVPGTAAYKAGSTTRPRPGASGSAGSASGAAGSASGGASSASGAKPSITAGSKYVVKSGDTLSGIAKTAGVSLADVRAANPKFKTDAKYKNGNMIWSGTKVNIPTKKK